MDLLTSGPLVTANPPRDPVRQTDGAVLPTSPLAEEALVADPRAALTPAQMVERKLASLLKRQPLPISLLRTARRTSHSRC
jgi:hypothetical protein